MKTNKLLLTIMFVAGTSSAARGSTKDSTPIVGGSEHSVGTPGTENEILAAFHAADAYQAYDALLSRAGFARVDSEPTVEAIYSDCLNQNFCEVHSRVVETYSNGTQQKSLAATVVTIDPGHSINVQFDTLDLDGLGRLVELGSEDSAAIVDALLTHGINDITGSVGNLHLQVTSIECSTIVIPDAVPSCTVRFGAQDIVLDDASSTALDAILSANGAFVQDQIVGVGRSLALLMTCDQPVVLHPEAACSFIALQ